MPKALVVEAEAVIREPLVALLAGWGFDAAGATTCAQAWEMVRNRPPDLVVIEPDVGGPNGFRFLRRLLSESTEDSTAVVILTSHAARACVLNAARLGIRHYLLKNDFDIEQFKHRIDLAMRRIGQQTVAAPDPAPAADPPAPGSLSAVTRLVEIEPRYTRSKATELIRNFGQCRALAPSFNNALRLLNSANSSIESIAQAIRQDQALAVRTLRAANSGPYSRGGVISSVEQAAVRIGMSALKQIIMGVAVMDQFGTGEFENLIEIHEFWEHALATGLLAQELARERTIIDPEQAFLAGLLHDIGRIIMIEQLGPDYVECLRLADRLGLPLHMVEKRRYNLDHADVVGVLFREWRLPDEIVSMIETHHLSLANLKHIQPGATGPSVLLMVADRLANAMLLGSSGQLWLDDVAPLAKIIELSPQMLERVLNRVPPMIEEFRLGLSAASGTPAERTLFNRALAGLPLPLSPEFLPGEPGFNGAGIALQQIAAKNQPPNLIVASLASPDQTRPLAAAIAASQAESNVPVLVLHPPKAGPPTDLAPDRTVVSLSIPTQLDTLLEHVGTVLEENADQSELQPAGTSADEHKH